MIRRLSFVFLLLGLVVLALLYLSVGNKIYGPNEIWQQAVVWELRMPRLFGVIFAGILLSVSGLLMQLMTNNPLAELTTTGASGGASFGLSIVLALGLKTNGWVTLLAAILGSFLVLGLVFLLAIRSRFHPQKLILVGSALGLLMTSLASAVSLSLHNSQAYFLFVVGSFSGLNIEKLSYLGGVVLIFLLSLVIFSKNIRLLAMGDEIALSLGVPVSAMRLLIIALVSLAAGVSVASVGVLGFLGLVAPQFARLFGKQNFFGLLGLTAIIGSLLLLVADLFSRTLFLPYELPAGSFLLLLGGPFFFYWMIRKESR